MAVDDPTRVTVVLIGVESPAPIAYPDASSLHSFTRLRGVRADLDWYSAFFREVVPPLNLKLIRPTPESPTETGAEALMNLIRGEFAGLQDGELLVLVLCGHGFQVRDLNGDERQDRLDEAYATSHGLILDDFFDEVWKTQTKVHASAVAIVDTCNSDTLAMRAAAERREPVINEDSGIPRLQLSASESWERAFETSSETKPRGYLSLALQDVWEGIPEARQSYRTLFLKTAELTGLRSPQTPRIRYYGPANEASFLDAAPFGYRAATDREPSNDVTPGPRRAHSTAHVRRLNQDSDRDARPAGMAAAHRVTQPASGLDPQDRNRRIAQLRDLLGNLGEDSDLRPPVRYAVGSHTSFGARSFAYWGLVLLDTAPITIGDDVLIGPDVQLLTTHPDHPRQAPSPIVIGDRVQLGAGVIIHPGVTIGAGTVVGAGSVITHDLPAGELAVGSPARIVPHAETSNPTPPKLTP